jgi:cell division septal protein FtsQ
MARVALPESRLRARRKKRRVRLAIFVGLAVAVVLAALVAASYLPFIQIKEVSVMGTQTLATSTVVDYIDEQISGRYLFIFPKRNIFLYPKRGVSQELLASFPELRSANVHAVNFHTIVADVVEREPKAKWCTDDVCYLMDQDGVIYASALGAGELVTYRGETTGERLPKQYLTQERFEALFALVDALAQRVGAVTWVNVDNNDDAEVRFESGFALKFALADPQGDVFERFELALTSEPFKSHKLSEFQYLDLRFGDKLYYKLK